MKTTNGSKKDGRSSKPSGTNTPASQHDNLKADKILAWPTLCIDNVSYQSLNAELLNLLIEKSNLVKNKSYDAYYKNEEEGKIAYVEDDVRFKIINTLNEIFTNRIFKETRKEFKCGIADSHGFTGDIRWVNKDIPNSYGEFIIEAKQRCAFGFTNRDPKEYVQILFDKTKEEAYLSSLESPEANKTKAEIRDIKNYIDKDKTKVNIFLNIIYIFFCIIVVLFSKNVFILKMLSILKQTWSYMKSLNEQLMYNAVFIDREIK